MYGFQAHVPCSGSPVVLRRFRTLFGSSIDGHRWQRSPTPFRSCFKRSMQGPPPLAADPVFYFDCVNFMRRCCSDGQDGKTQRRARVSAANFPGVLRAEECGGQWLDGRIERRWSSRLAGFMRSRLPCDRPRSHVCILSINVCVVVATISPISVGALIGSVFSPACVRCFIFAFLLLVFRS